MSTYFFKKQVTLFSSYIFSLIDFKLYIDTTIISFYFTREIFRVLENAKKIPDATSSTSRSQGWEERNGPVGGGVGGGGGEETVRGAHDGGRRKATVLEGCFLEVSQTLF